jgi:hypothetical protein
MVNIGDVVDRRMGAGGPVMKMVVVAIGDNLLYCCPQEWNPKLDRPLDTWRKAFYKGCCWTFDLKTGVEEDAELKWGVAFGRTGTYLEL